MKCARALLLVALFSVARCFKVVHVAVDSDYDKYSPSRIFAHSNSTVKFLFPSSACGGKDPYAKGWDLHVKNKSQLRFGQIIVMEAQLGRLGSYVSSKASREYSAINPPSTCEYAEFRRAADLPKPKSNMTRAAQFACPTATKSNLPISSPTIATQLSQPMTSTAPSPTRSPAQRNVGAIVGGTVVGVFAGIIALVLLANAAFLLWRKRNGDLEANKSLPALPPPLPPAAPPARAVENPLPALPALVETTQVSVPGDELRTFQWPPSGGVSPNNALDASIAASPPSMNDMKAQGPTMRNMSIRFLPSPPNAQSEMVPKPSADAPPTPSVYLIPSDPFASVGQSLPVGSSRDQQQEPQHQMMQRTQSPRRPVRQSRSDSIFQLTQPTIPEQEMEIITQEVVTFLLTDATSAEQRMSRHIYSSPPAGQSPTLEHIRHSPTLSYIQQRSPTPGFSPPPLAFRRPLSRGSSMEGD
ncbi:hypothetical protein F5887DRAFT_919890 [Amanita rubescens]|nr:hypothetical protein F5887DRAFT_919890 [Amanita rubescens]